MSLGKGDSLPSWAACLVTPGCFGVHWLEVGLQGTQGPGPNLGDMLCPWRQQVCASGFQLICSQSVLLWCELCHMTVFLGAGGNGALFVHKTKQVG